MGSLVGVRVPSGTEQRGRAGLGPERPPRACREELRGGPGRCTAAPGPPGGIPAAAGAGRASPGSRSWAGIPRSWAGIPRSGGAGAGGPGARGLGAPRGPRVPGTASEGGRKGSPFSAGLLDRKGGFYSAVCAGAARSVKQLAGRRALGSRDNRCLFLTAGGEAAFQKDFKLQQFRKPEPPGFGREGLVDYAKSGPHLVKPFQKVP